MIKLCKMKLQTIILPLTFVVLVSLIACTNHKQETILANTTPCDTNSSKYAAIIAPIINNNCSSANGCHGGTNKGSFAIETYQDVKDNLSSIISDVKTGRMPKNAPKLDDCKITKLEMWIANGAQNN
jgi:hypothetical protein